MFEQRHYVFLADILHGAHETSTSDEWKLIYDKVYTPLVEKLQEDNERFKPDVFSFRVATGK